LAAPAAGAVAKYYFDHILHMAILSGKRAVTQTKLTLRQSCTAALGLVLQSRLCLGVSLNVFGQCVISMRHYGTLLHLWLSHSGPCLSQVCWSSQASYCHQRYDEAGFSVSYLATAPAAGAANAVFSYTQCKLQV